MKVRLFLICGIIFFVMFSCFPCFISQKENSENFKNNLNPHPSSFDIIIINNNSDLANIASSGDGSKASPYIIEFRTVNGSKSDYGIFFNNTDKYFRLVNCTVYNASIGIYLNNVSNAYIAENEVFSNENSGIYLDNSLNNSLIKNTIYNNNETSLMLYNTNLTKIISNQIYSNSKMGIFLNSSNNNKIITNILSNNNNSGIKTEQSNENQIIGNIISFHYNAIYLYRSNQCIIEYNNGEFNNNNIIEINCQNNTFIENFIQNSEEDEKENKNEIALEELNKLQFTLILYFLFLVSNLSYLIFKLFRKYNIKHLNLNRKSLNKAPIQ